MIKMRLSWENPPPTPNPNSNLHPLFIFIKSREPEIARQDQMVVDRVESSHQRHTQNWSFFLFFFSSGLFFVLRPPSHPIHTPAPPPHLSLSLSLSLSLLPSPPNHWYSLKIASPTLRFWLPSEKYLLLAVQVRHK